jgi:ADP-ribose pyrophosphatase
MIKPWPTVSTRLEKDYRVFRLRTDVKVSPRNGLQHEFYVLEGVNWVNVIALTPDDHLVMVEQYRHGSNTVELEIPGGMIDPHESSPIEAAVRELREETGYEGGNARILGEVFANPAIMTNVCYTVQVDQCQVKHALRLDASEDIQTKLVPMRDIPRLVAEGRIKHSLVIVAFYHFDRSQPCSKSVT